MDENENAQTQDSKHQIEVRNLWKVFGDDPDKALEAEYRSKSRAEIQEELGSVVALRDVSFDVDVGQIFVVMGLSGSGKSTLVRCLIRLIEATDGSVAFEGDDILTYTSDELIEFRRQKVAMVFQHFGLLPHRRVLDNVAYGLEVQGIDKETRYQRALESIETVGLKGWEDYYPREMSGGMQQRVGLARALAVNPDVLLMDEPFSGLDPLIRREMQDELVTLQSELHKTIIFITHDLDEALKLGDRIAIMRDGEIIQNAPPSEIVDNPADDYVEAFVQGVSRTKVIEAEAIMQEPEAVVYDWQSPDEAIDLMQSKNVFTAFVLSEDRVLKGFVRERDLIQKRPENLKNGTVLEASAVTKETVMEDILPIAVECEYPIAVVNENKNLLGEIDRGTLLAGIVEQSKVGAAADGEE